MNDSLATLRSQFLYLGGGRERENVMREGEEMLLLDTTAVAEKLNKFMFKVRYCPFKLILKK